jgi:glucokinase
MILAGDVGGTKVHLALYNFANGRLLPVRDEKFPAHEFASLDDVVNKFLADGKEPREAIVAACFGCPGPVRDGRLKLTNLPWTLDTRDLVKSLGIPHIFLINDLEANGYGIPELAPESIFTLHSGDENASGHAGLIAAGTGLGEALMIWDGTKHRPIPEDPNAVIGQCAEDGSSSLCYETMKIFAGAYGAEAGNIALKVLATGGIYLGGGIAPKILKTLKNGTFLQAFLDKGRLSPLLESIPVRVILDDTCALLGAAAFAEARASEASGRSERAASLQ